MFELNIETDNDAFQGNLAQELARILREVATKLENGTFENDARGKFQNVALDLNGNVVGRARWQA